MECTQSKVGAVTVLSPSGALIQSDAVKVADVLQAALNDAYGRLVIDFTEVTLIDSRGIEVLLDAADALGETGQVLKISAANDLIREIMDLTEVAGSFEYFEDVNAAARSYL